MNVHVTEQEFRFYDMPKRDPVLVFSGDAWWKNYGDGSKKLHFHNILEIGICRAGSGTMVYEQEERPYGPGDLSVIPRHVPHTTYNEPGVLSLWDYIFIDEGSYLERYLGEDLPFVRGMQDHINSRYLLLPGAAHADLWSAAQGIVREFVAGGPYMQEIMNAQIVSLLLAIARENRTFDKAQDQERREKSRKIRNVLAYIDENYARPLRIGDLAQVAGLSEPHFRRVFGSIMNMSPADYVNMIRVQKACTLLMKTDLSVDRIAEESGFTTASTFNRNFRTYLNMTPLQWKKTKGRSKEGDGGIRVTAYRGWE